MIEAVHDLFKFVGEYGLPTVLLVGLALYTQRRERAWEREREEMWKRFAAEQNARITDAKDAFEKISTSQANLVTATLKLAEINQAHTLTKELIKATNDLGELADEMKQRLRETGAHRPFRGGGE